MSVIDDKTPEVYQISGVFITVLGSGKNIK